jgi:endoglucanase
MLNPNRNPADFSDYIRSKGTKFVDGRGQNILLRGVGIGNWLLPEGYMWKFGMDTQSPREIERFFDKLLGHQESEKFWEKYESCFITEEDIRLIADLGFNHIRLPINSRKVITEAGLPIESGLQLIDQIIEWSRKHQLWVLLDLHGAPGGQTGTNIDDSPNNRPELFTEKGYWDLTIKLWELLASRYRDDKTVLGYDLLNEPLAPQHWTEELSRSLILLYKELTQAIRLIDPNHLLMFEGTHWASNWEIFTEVFDSNSALQFHKYWSAPDQVGIENFLNIRDELQIPIYMGEGGENNGEWIYTAFRLYETYDIGWNFWPWKKIETFTSPLSVSAPRGWNEILQPPFEARGGTSLNTEQIISDLLNGMMVSQCRHNSEVISALFSRGHFKIPAWGYGFRGRGESYFSQSNFPHPGLRSNESVAIHYLDGRKVLLPDFEQNDGRNYRNDEVIVVSLSSGDWLEYEIEGEFELSDVKVITSEQDDALFSIARSNRGFKVTARAALTIVGVELG